MNGDPRGLLTVILLELPDDPLKAWHALKDVLEAGFPLEVMKWTPAAHERFPQYWTWFASLELLASTEAEDHATSVRRGLGLHVADALGAREARALAASAYRLEDWDSMTTGLKHVARDYAEEEWLHWCLRDADLRSPERLPALCRSIMNSGITEPYVILTLCSVLDRHHHRELAIDLLLTCCVASHSPVLDLFLIDLAGMSRSAAGSLFEDRDELFPIEDRWILDEFWIVWNLQPGSLSDEMIPSDHRGIARTTIAYFLGDPEPMERAMLPTTETFDPRFAKTFVLLMFSVLLARLADLEQEDMNRGRKVLGYIWVTASGMEVPATP